MEQRKLCPNDELLQALQPGPRGGVEATAVVAVAAMAAVDSAGMDVASSTSMGWEVRVVSGCAMH